MSIPALYQKDKVSASNHFIFLIVHPKDKTRDDADMRREEIRRLNARQLAVSVGGPAAFARRIQMGDSQVTQIIGDNAKKNIGNIVAPRIERAFNKPEGWLDVIHDHTATEAPRLSVVETAEDPAKLAEEVLEIGRLYMQCTKVARRFLMESAIDAEKVVVAPRIVDRRNKTQRGSPE